MVQLKVLTGKKAGTAYAARRFPVQIGRSSKAELQLEEDGVWDEHLRLDFNPGEGFVLSVQENALASVNAEPIQRTTLRNGDLIQLGSSKLQFWLGETRQVSLGWREWLLWSGIAMVSLGQVGLIYWLLR
jgi:pSer/pThr/pTyr-binding forkhead associated (FHA) protein